MINKNILLASLVCASFTGAATTYQTTDWMPENSFTQGVEGPAVDKSGNLYAVNFDKEGTVGIVSEKNIGKTFLTLDNGSVANGIRFDLQGNMFMADYVNHNVLKYSASDNQLSIFSHNDEMYQPNDLAIMDRGYPSYELFAMISKQYNSNFLIRMKKTVYKDIQFLLVGPAWWWVHWLKRLNINY